MYYERSFVIVTISKFAVTIFYYAEMKRIVVYRLSAAFRGHIFSIFVKVKSVE